MFGFIWESHWGMWSSLVTVCCFVFTVASPPLYYTGTMFQGLLQLLVPMFHHMCTTLALECASGLPASSTSRRATQPNFWCMAQHTALVCVEAIPSPRRFLPWFLAFSSLLLLLQLLRSPLCSLPPLVFVFGQDYFAVDNKFRIIMLT